MLRIHFTEDDLTRTRVVSALDPLWEVVLSLHQLRGRTVDLDLVSWRESALRTIRPPERRPMMERMLRLVPPRGYFPDFLTPSRGVNGLDEGLDDILHASKHRLRTDLTKLAGSKRLPGWASALADGNAGQMTALTGALRDYHRLTIDQHLQTIQPSLAADTKARTTAFRQGGAGAMLASFAPLFRWRPPMLTAPYPADKDLHLDGRGLLLVPSYFCRRTPVTFSDTELRPVLVYPLTGFWRRPPQQLVALLGKTRAGVLHAIVTPSTTNEIARALGVSAATASEHATVLRKAGLITSQRYANSVLHALTSLGEALLQSP